MVPNHITDEKQVFVNLDGDVMVEHLNPSGLLVDDVSMFKINRLSLGNKHYFQLAHYNVFAMLPGDSEVSSDEEEESDEIPHDELRVPDDVAKDVRYRREWLIEGSFLMGCVLSACLYYIIAEDDTHMRKKKLLVDDAGIDIMDLPGRISDMKLSNRTVCIVTSLDKLYALENDSQWKIITSIPPSCEFQDFTVTPDNEHIVLLSNGEDLVIVKNGVLVQTVKGIRPYKCRFLPGLMGEFVAGLFVGHESNPRVFLDALKVSTRESLARCFPWWDFVGCESFNAVSVMVEGWMTSVRVSSASGSFATMHDLEEALGSPWDRTDSSCSKP
ncbi:hypothetical protein FOL47_010604 [Perkinsus chesapeaki]|uniref:Uncharacterized protein n=1 Tax=Perkinsus chesapeaki TaxID=330153 RepID=A0A7J6L3Q9_PERCH|nr:hypothetical protein FOL47_010604 [Perkinsus chesapeaki]